MGVREGSFVFHAVFGAGALLLTLSPTTALAQPAPPAPAPEPAPDTAPAPNPDAPKPPDGPPAAGDQGGQGGSDGGEGGGGGDPATNGDSAGGDGGGDATDGDEDDDWGLGEVEEYEAPMVVADMSQRSEDYGYTREPHEKYRWTYYNLTAARLNPLGLVNRFRTGLRIQLSNSTETAYFDSYINPQLDTEISPAFGYVGGRLEFQPIALLNFFGSYGMFGTFSSFSYTRSFENAQAEYDDDLLGDTRDQDYTALGNRAIISGKFQFGLGGVIMRSQTQAWYFGIPLQGNDTVFYEASLDTLVPNKGWTITNDTDLLFWTDWDLIIGARYTVTSPLYRDEHNPGRNINGPMHRVGPFFAYQFFDDGIGSGWNKPTILVLTQWWAKHRYRTTQRPGLPYLVIGFKQEGDFFTSEKK